MGTEHNSLSWCVFVAMTRGKVNRGQIVEFYGGLWGLEGREDIWEQAFQIQCGEWDGDKERTEALRINLTIWTAHVKDIAGLN